MRIRFTIFLLSMLIGLLGCKEEKTEPPKKEDARGDKKPNIVLFMADDQGWGDLSSSGNTNLNTPNIDAIAKYGVSFENFYVQPVCSPTRAELLTGRHFPRTGVYSTSAGGERMDHDETTLAEMLQKAGYRTAAYGKWHNGMQPPYHPNSQGFDDFYGFASGHWGNYFSPMLEHNGAIVQGDGFLVDDLTDHGLEFIQQNQDTPFFLYLPFNTPHSPMQVPDEYWQPFEERELKMFADKRDTRKIGNNQDAENTENAENPKFTKAALAMVENIDYNVGRIMARLRKLYLEDDTIVIYLSDNGPNSFRWNGGMRGKKGDTDEGGTRSPFYMQWKDSLPERKTISQIASSLDILPTLAEMVGVPPITAKPIDGKDLTPLLFESNVEWNDRIIYNHWNGKTSLRTQEYRLDDENRLYRISKDRGQKTDLSARLPQLKDSLIQEKQDWLAEVQPKPAATNVKPLAAETEKVPDTTGGDLKPQSAATDDRPFTLGHPSYLYTQLPARDAIAHGNIERSNKYPNDSFFTDWKSVNDSITWEVDVLADGHFKVQLYYAAKEENLGSIIELSLGKSKIAKKVNEAHDPPLKGMENDRVPRQESYVKDFKPMDLGTMVLKKGKGTLTLKALEIPGEEAVDFRLLLFRKVE
ncbi:MAG: arylsulfatase [Pricia sp.]